MDNIDYIFNAVFIIEFMIKVISLGFFMDYNTYLPDAWNKLDFAIVMFSIIDMSA